MSINEKIRKNLTKKILEKSHSSNKKVPLNPDEITYKHCKIIAEFLGATISNQISIHLCKILYILSDF